MMVELAVDGHGWEGKSTLGGLRCWESAGDDSDVGSWYGTKNNNSS